MNAPSVDPDHQLISRVARGDEAAFLELLSKYKTPVHAFVYRMLNDAEETDDVAQEVFIRVYRTADLYQPRAKFTTWLFAIANNLATDRLRKRARHPTIGGDEAQSRIDRALDSRDNPSQSLQHEEQAVAVQGAIEQLPIDQRAALILAEYEELSYAEIADVMGSSVKSVESRIYRAKEFLRKKLARWL